MKCLQFVCDPCGETATSLLDGLPTGWSTVTREADGKVRTRHLCPRCDARMLRLFADPGGKE